MHCNVMSISVICLSVIKLKIVIKSEITLMDIILHLPTSVVGVTLITHHLQREGSGKVPGSFSECSGNVQGILKNV